MEPEPANAAFPISAYSALALLEEQDRSESLRSRVERLRAALNHFPYPTFAAVVPPVAVAAELHDAATALLELLERRLEKPDA